MSWMARSEIHPLTWASVQAPSAIAVYTDEHGYPCGCRAHPRRPDRSFHLCEYHDGFDDGVRAAQS